MKTSKNKSLIFSCIVLAMAWLTIAGCESQTSIVDPFIIQEAQIGDLNFYSLQEPQTKIFEFEIFGDPTNDWSGRFPGFSEGNIQVQTLSSTMRGRTFHVVQTWMIVPPEPIVPPDPIEPVNISLKGILNIANGNVVLNGMSDELGVNVRVRGQLMEVESGAFSIGGELMFNPQPEPPPSPGAIGHGR